MTVVSETPATAVVDGDGGLGHFAAQRATELAITKAKAKGVALGAARHLGHYGSAGHYVRRAMEAGCTAFSVQGHHPSWFGEGGGNKGQQSAYWGNPPICFGLPSQEEPPLVLDAATCILADYQRGPQFDALQELIPAAFFKSMGYTGVATALGGTFVGMSNPRAAAVSGKWPGARQGGLIIVMNLGVFAPPAEVRSGVDLLVRGVRQTMEPVRGYPEATLPGTIEHRKEQEYRQTGVPVAIEDLEALEKAGEEFGVTPGWL
ncbi:MAG: Ldh family oxidoreductase [Armatimonadetes bacterium]|nr:Ldh family oxidoreductase [Armatimonadota bacterium]